MNYGHRKKSDTSSIAEVCGLSAGFGFQELHKLLLLCMCAFRLRFELRRFLDGLEKSGRRGSFDLA